MRDSVSEFRSERVTALRWIVSSSQMVDLVFLYFIFHFHFLFIFIFLFLEQLGLGLEVINHTVTSVTI